jgi:hypothetical protein
MSALLLALTLSLPAGDAPDTLVVCPDGLRASLQPWLDHRLRQGHRLRVVPPGESAAQIQSEIRTAAEPGGLRSVVLVGDTTRGDRPASDTGPRGVPTHYAKSKVGVLWGSEAEIATDNPYADLDGDSVPDVAIGRLSADTPAELSVIVDKILAYENSPHCGPWRRRINLVAGVGGFGKLADTVLEMAAKNFLTDGIPGGYQTTMTYGSWQSPYCPDPRRFHEATLGSINQGCLFWIYIGHGQRRYLDHVQVPGGAFPILDTDDVDKMQCRQGPPIALMLACYTAAFDHPDDCLAEEMLRAAGGPVAVVGGSRVTMPYAMTVISTVMMDEYFQNRPKTLGELLLRTKRNSVAQRGDDPRHQMLDAIATALSPAPDELPAEREEHLALFNLIGDPLLRLRHPGIVQVQAPAQVVAGQPVRIRVRCPEPGSCVVELAARRDRSRIAAPSRPQFLPTHEFLAAMDEVYRETNDPVWTSQTLSGTSGDFELELDVPDKARGPCHVRVYHTGNGDFALGDCEVFVRRPRS